MRIVLLGKTGHGKSSSGNTILGDSAREQFVINSSPNSVTSKCEVLTGCRPGKKTQIQIFDTPGLFDTRMPDEEFKREIVKCIALSAPGPHAFIIMLSVGKYTKQEMETVAKITRSFGEDAFKYSAVLFTHGNDLDEGQTIEQFVEQSKELKELVEKCGGGCHVIDNKYWNQEHEYRSNSVRVEKLLNTIEEMVRQNGGHCYTNEMLQAVEKEIQALLPKFKSRAKAVFSVMYKLMVQCAGLTTGALLGALLGIGTAGLVVIAFFANVFRSTEIANAAKPVVPALEGATGRLVAANTGLYVAGNIVAAAGVVGAIGGGIVGFQAVEDGDGVCDAVKKAARANWENAKYLGAEAKGLVKELASEITTVIDAVREADSVVTKILEKTTINEGHNTKKNE